MQNLSNLAALSRRLERDGRPFAVATLVKKEGSTYRLPGARMIVQDDGTRYGMISGGCLEDEVAVQALAVLRTGHPVVRRFDLTDENAMLGYGAGCNGAVHVLIESGAAGLDMVHSCLSQRRDAVLAHIISSSSHPEYVGARQLLTAQQPPRCSPGWPAAVDVSSDAARVKKNARSEVVTRHASLGMIEVFVEAVAPIIRLIVFGSGPDAGPLVQIARMIGWKVSVVGTKPTEILRKRFPGASDYSFLMHAADFHRVVSVDRYSAAVVMNHNKVRDEALVRALVRSQVPYIGVLGPRKRCEKVVPRDLPDGIISRVYGPTGLDIGAETPEEIALSIASEILAELTGHQGGSLRSKHGAVHEIDSECARES